MRIANQSRFGQGGIPLKDKSGNIIGAVGVSGSSVENDHTVAEAGVKALYS